MNAPARLIDPETELRRVARWWSGWDGFNLNEDRPTNPDAAEGWDAAQTARTIRIAFTFPTGDRP